MPPAHCCCLFSSSGCSLKLPRTFCCQNLWRIIWMQRQTSFAHPRSLVWIFNGCTLKRTQIHKSQLSPWVPKLKVMTLLPLTWDKLSILFIPEILTCFKFHPWSVRSAGSLVSGQAKLLGLDTAEKIETRFIQLHQVHILDMHNSTICLYLTGFSRQDHNRFQKKKIMSEARLPRLP